MKYWVPIFLCWLAVWILDGWRLPVGLVVGGAIGLLIAAMTERDPYEEQE